jgi:hypothetical protein
MRFPSTLEDDAVAGELVGARLVGEPAGWRVGAGRVVVWLAVAIGGPRPGTVCASFSRLVREGV